MVEGARATASAHASASHDSVFAARGAGDTIPASAGTKTPGGATSSVARVSLTMNTPSAVSTSLGCLLLWAGASSVLPGCSDTAPFPDVDGPGLSDRPAP